MPCRRGALRYKPAGREFDFRWSHWNFSVIQSFRSHYGRGVDSASNRNEYQVYFLGGKGGRCVRLTILPPSCAVVMKSRNLNFLEPSGPLQACNGTALPLPAIQTRKEGRYNTTFIDLGTRRNLSASRPCRFNPVGRTFLMHRTEGRLRPTAGRGTVERRPIAARRRESNTELDALQLVNFTV